MTPRQLREHLFRLEWTGKLHKHLPRLESAMPWADIISLLQYVFYVAIAAHLTRMVLAAAEAQKAGGEPRPPDGDILWLLLLMVLSQVARYGWWLLRTRDEAIGHRLRRRGKLLPAAIVQVHDSYFDPDQEKRCGAWLLMSFDRQAHEAPARLDAIARKLFALKRADRSKLSPEHAAIAWSIFHEIGLTESRSVPEDLTGGLRTCQMSFAWVHREDFHHEARLWVLALPRTRSPLGVAAIPREVLELPEVPWITAFLRRWTNLLG